MSHPRLLQEENDDLDLEALLDPYIYLLLGLESAITLVSFIGASFIIVTYLKFSNLRSFAYKLVTYISCSDFLFYFGKLLSIIEVNFTNPQTLCKFQGVIMSFGQLASVLWSAVIAFTLYSTVIRQKHHFEEKYSRYFFYFALGIPSIITLLLWAFGLIGGNGDRCWIIFDARHRWSSFSLQMGTFYFPLWIVIAFNTYVYIELIKYLKTINAKVSKKRIALYPLILIICWFFPTLHVIQTSFGYESEFMNALHNFCESLQGILNAIIYGMNTDVKRSWKRLLNKKFGFFPKYTETKNSESHSEIDEVPETPLDPLDQKPYYNYDDFENFNDDEDDRMDKSKKLRRDSSWEVEMSLRLAQKSG